MSQTPTRPGPAQNLSPVERALQQQRQMLGVLYNTLTRTRQRLYALEAAERLRAQGRSARMPIEFRSQFGEDLLVYDAFEGKPEGFFIEVGAFDGYNYSVSYALEAMGWNGLLIEAIPQRAEECKARRPHSRVVNAALSRRGSVGTAAFTVTQDQYGGMLSYLNTTPQHVQDTSHAQRSTVDVTVTWMDELLKDHAGEIDVASIDVEGGEVPLLQGFDLHKHRPKLLLLEDNSRGADPALAQYMSTQPYTFVGWLEVNSVWVRADLPDLRGRIVRSFQG